MLPPLAGAGWGGGSHGGTFAHIRHAAYVKGVNTPKPCPICRKPAVERYRPFCSARCKNVDLARWFSGAYAIPAVESDDDSTDEALRGRES